MTIDRNVVLFFDASCLVAATGSPTGGSGFLLDCCRRGFLTGAVSHPVLVEVERNAALQLGPRAMDAYHLLIATTPMRLAPVPPDPEGGPLAAIVGEKDAHVLAAALAVAASYLLTLDQATCHARERRQPHDSGPGTRRLHQNSAPRA